MEITRDWILEKNVEKKAKLSREHVYTQRRGLKENEITSLNKLQELFNEGIFRNYIDVDRPFHYSNCIRGTDFYDNVPFLTIPKNMQVISRTDLNLDHPAVEGKMIYKKGDFQDRIKKLYGGI